MWKLLSGIAALLALVAAILSFKNFSSYREDKDLLDKNDTRRFTAEAHKTQAENAFASSQENLERLTNEKKMRASDLAKSKSVLAEQEAKLEAKEQELSAVRDEVESFENKLAKVGEIKEIESKLNAFTTELAELDQQIISLKTVQAVSLDKKRSVETQIERYKQLISNQASGKMPAIKTTVRSVHEPWGFVVLNAGDNRGVVTKATLDVLRGGSVIGQLVVTNVEKSLATANIVRSSLAEGETIRPGDVITVSKDSLAATL